LLGRRPELKDEAIENRQKLGTLRRAECNGERRDGRPSGGCSMRKEIQKIDVNGTSGKERRGETGSTGV